MSKRGLILYAVDSLGNPVKVLADPDGTLRVDGTVSIAGTVDVSDRAARLLGIIYGGQGQQFKQTPVNYNLQVELATGATLYDARQIRPLTSADVISAVQSGLWVVGTANVESTNNSSTSLLGAGGIFTGTKDDLQNYVAVVVMIYADQASATNGASVQFSEDGTNWDYIETFTVAAGVTRSQIFTRHARYIRIVYTNGATPQTTFRLQTSLLAVAPHPFSLSLATSPNADEHVPLTRAVITGQTTGGGGGFVNVKVNPSGTLTVDASNSTGLSTDVTDRAARLLGVIYGSQGQQIKQTATNNNLAVELLTGATLYDARQIRALTSSDVVTVQQTTRTSLTTKPEREDLTSQGGLYSPNGAGVQVIAPSGSTKIKVFKAGYHSAALGLHYFYFGTTTTAPVLPSGKVFLMSNAAGHYRQTNTHPDVSDAGDGLYICSATAESNMPVDVQFARE